MTTEQEKFWMGQFGREYTDRNTFSVTELDELYQSRYGISRTEMNRSFLNDLKLNRILEVGCNVGNQLRCVQEMGFSGLHGIELQQYAVDKARELCSNITIVQGSAFELPFPDNSFDLVYTSGVLIHIAPDDLDKIMDEVYRVCDKYIWGIEYYSDQYIEKEYRNNKGKLWKADFMSIYQKRYPDLRLIKEVKYKYLGEDLADQMYLFEKVKERLS